MSCSRGSNEGLFGVGVDEWLGAMAILSGLRKTVIAQPIAQMKIDDGELLDE